MEFDKEFRIPFRQTLTYEPPPEADAIAEQNDVCCVKTYGRWGPGNSVASEPTAQRAALGLLGQSASNDNCPQLADVYSQLVNYEYCKIHAVEEEFRVVDYFTTNDGAGISRRTPHFTKDPSAQLLWKLTTNNTEESALNAKSADISDYLRALAHTRRGTSFNTRLVTEMRYMKGQSGRRMLNNGGRTQTPGNNVAYTLCASEDDPGGVRSTTAGKVTFNLGNGTELENNVLNHGWHGSNLFYWAKNQIYDFGNGQTAPQNVVAKYWWQTANAPSTFKIFNDNKTNLSFPRNVWICPLTSQNAGVGRTWKIQNVTTLIVRARGYTPAITNQSRYITPDDDVPPEKKIKIDDE